MIALASESAHSRMPVILAPKTEKEPKPRAEALDYEAISPPKPKA